LAISDFSERAREAGDGCADEAVMDAIVMSFPGVFKNPPEIDLRKARKSAAETRGIDRVQNL
jgi:hypothetical protein